MAFVGINLYIDLKQNSNMQKQNRNTNTNPVTSTIVSLVGQLITGCLLAAIVLAIAVLLNSDLVSSWVE